MSKICLQRHIHSSLLLSRKPSFTLLIHNGTHVYVVPFLAKYTPPTPTRRNCFVASCRRRRCVHEFATTADGFERTTQPSAASLQSCSQWVTTADGCVYTDDTTKLSPTRCEFVYTPPTRRDSTVSSRRRRRCVLGFKDIITNVNARLMFFQTRIASAVLGKITTRTSAGKSFAALIYASVIRICATMRTPASTPTSKTSHSRKSNATYARTVHVQS